MFNADYRTHTGFLQAKNHTNNSKVNRYQSVAAFDPKKPGEPPPFHIFDLDAPGMSMNIIQQDYMSAVQNMLLIKRAGENKWGQQKKIWSVTALSEGGKRLILLIFSGSPLTMHDRNQDLLSARIGVVAAQHLEGGPAAQMYLSAGTEELDLFGSYATGIRRSTPTTRRRRYRTSLKLDL